MSLDFVNKVIKKRNYLVSIMLLSPTLILLALFFIIPMILTIVFSFTNLSLTGEAAAHFHFSGLQNFVNMLSDQNFYHSVLLTVLFVLLSAVFGQCLLGFLIAFMMKGKNKNFRRVIGLIIISAWVIPEVVVAFCWVSMLSDQGTFNQFITFAFNIKPVAWLFEFPMVAVIIANVWRGTAFSMMVFQAALDDIPEEIEEAAIIDGATRSQVLFRITIPLMKGTIATNIMLVTLQTIGVFSLIYTMTGGGPSNATATLPVFMYQEAFVNYQLGYGTTISLAILIIGALSSIIYIKVLKVEI